jgi:N-acetylglutamate synthase
MPLRADLPRIRYLEQLASRGWPALEMRDIRGWRLGLSRGFTVRANSISALGPDAETDRDALSAVEAPYRERSQLPIWRITPLAPPAITEILTAQGYRPDWPSLLQASRLDSRFRGDPKVRILPSPTSRWLDIYRMHVEREHDDAMLRLLGSIHPPVGFALLDDGAAIAIGIGALEDDHMGLFNVLVGPDARRQGCGRRLTESLYAWAVRRGARHAYLQVVSTNAAAVSLYAKQGFETIYEYDYLRPPAS